MIELYLVEMGQQGDGWDMKMVGSKTFWVRTQNIWVRHHGIIILVAEKANSLNKKDLCACLLSVN
jgi:hypothetical protein